MTEDAASFSAFVGSSESLIFVQPARQTDFELMLHVGSNYSDRYPNGSDAMIQIPPNGFVLHPGKGVTVETDEFVRLPLNVFGLILAKGRLAFKQALLVPATKIDPNFAGKLRLFLFNISGTAYTIKAGDNVACVLFLPVSHTPDQAPYVPDPVLQGRKTGRLRILLSALKTSSVPVWLATAAALLSALFTALTYLNQPAPSATQNSPSAQPPPAIGP